MPIGKHLKQEHESARRMQFNTYRCGGVDPHAMAGDAMLTPAFQAPYEQQQMRAGLKVSPNFRPSFSAGAAGTRAINIGVQRQLCNG